MIAKIGEMGKGAFGAGLEVIGYGLEAKGKKAGMLGSLEAGKQGRSALNWKLIVFLVLSAFLLSFSGRELCALLR